MMPSSLPPLLTQPKSLRLNKTVSAERGKNLPPASFAQKVDISRKILSMAYLVHSTYPHVFDFLCKARHNCVSQTQIWRNLVHSHYCFIL
jgi:hypothetical protein